MNSSQKLNVFSLVLVTDFSFVVFILKKGLPTDWLRSKSVESGCIRLPTTVRVAKMSVLTCKFSTLALPFNENRASIGHLYAFRKQS